MLFHVSVTTKVTRSSCQSSQNLEVSTSLTLSSATLVTSGCATSTLRLSARAGQTLNVSIVDFSTDSSLHAANSCLNYLQLKDTRSTSSLPVCAGSSVRERHVMQSSGDEVEARFTLHDPSKQRFLLTFQGTFKHDVRVMSPLHMIWSDDVTACLK